MNKEFRPAEPPTPLEAGAAAPDFPFWKRNVALIPVTGFLFTLGLSMTTPFVPLMVRDLGVTEHLETWIGNMMLVFFLMGFVMNPIWGGLADHYGRKLMVLRATFGMGLCMLLATLATTPLMFACLYTLVGIFNGGNSAFNSLLVATTPKRRIGTALTLTQSGNLIGRTLGPGLSAIAVGMIAHYQMILRLSGAVMVLGGVMACFVRDVFRPVEGRYRPRWIADLRSLIAVPRMGTLLFLSFISNILWGGSTTVVTLFLLRLVAQNPGWGSEALWVSAVATGLSVASLLGLPLWARLLDKGDPGRVLIYSCIAAMVTHVPFLFLQTPLQLVLIRIAFGLTAIGMQPAIVRLLSQYAPAGMESRAIAYGQSSQFLASGIAPFLAGTIAPVLGLRVYFALTIVVTAIGAWSWLRSSRRAA
jgi:MFS family permease